MHRVYLEGLQVMGRVGVYPFEHGIDQRLVLSVRADLDLTKAGRTDDLQHALDYDGLAQACRDVVAARHHRLIEAIAHEVLDRLLETHPAVDRVWVRVEKPGAVPDAATVAVEMERDRPQ